MVSPAKDIEDTTTGTSFASAEESRRNPQAWVEKLRPEFMKRIRHYEDYLAKWGITAQTGIEQEFYVVTKNDKNGNPERPTIRQNSEFPFPYFQHFPNSPFVEKLHKELEHDNSYEIVVGTGYKDRKGAKKYPHPSLEPSVMVRATESAKRLISKEAKKPGNPYNSTDIDFNPIDRGRYAQQVNISLWDNEENGNKKKRPLFDNHGVNELSECCIKNLLETQNATVALYTVNPNSFQRFFTMSEVRHFTSNMGIKLDREKKTAPSVTWRDKNNIFNWAKEGEPEYKGDYGYIENRLGGSDMPPYVNMLITLAGVAEGVREYVEKNGIKSKEELLKKVQEGNKVMSKPDRYGEDEKPYTISTVLTEEGCKKYPAYELPKTQVEALKTTENSKLAKKILGDDLYDKFISGYKQRCQNSQIEERTTTPSKPGFRATLQSLFR